MIIGLDINDLKVNLFTVHPAVNLEWYFIYYKAKNLALVLDVNLHHQKGEDWQHCYRYSHKWEVSLCIIYQSTVFFIKYHVIKGYKWTNSPVLSLYFSLIVKANSPSQTHEQQTLSALWLSLSGYLQNGTIFPFPSKAAWIIKQRYVWLLRATSLYKLNLSILSVMSLLCPRCRLWNIKNILYRQ